MCLRQAVSIAIEVGSLIDQKAGVCRLGRGILRTISRELRDGDENPTLGSGGCNCIVAVVSVLGMYFFCSMYAVYERGGFERNG